jgi:hypothetical protein
VSRKVGKQVLEPLLIINLDGIYERFGLATEVRLEYRSPANKLLQMEEQGVVLLVRDHGESHIGVQLVKGGGQRVRFMIGQTGF